MLRAEFPTVDLTYVPDGWHDKAPTDMRQNNLTAAATAAVAIAVVMMTRREKSQGLRDAKITRSWAGRARGARGLGGGGRRPGPARRYTLRGQILMFADPSVDWTAVWLGSAFHVSDPGVGWTGFRSIFHVCGSRSGLG